MEDREDNVDNNVDILLELERLRELEEVQVLIDKMDFENPFTADEFVQYDKFETTAEMMSNEEILNAILPNQEEETVEEGIPLPIITHNEAVESYDKVILYLQQQNDNFDAKNNDLKFIKKLKKDALKRRFISARQGNLDDFINVTE